jgi:hypothetical protein
VLIQISLPIIDGQGLVDYINVEVTYWVKPGQSSSSISEPIDDQIIIESVIDDAGTDYVNVLTREQQRNILKKCDKELRDAY